MNRDVDMIATLGWLLTLIVLVVEFGSVAVCALAVMVATRALIRAVQNLGDL
ncbi:MAG: hypothetical protein JNM98_06235 [Rhodocyclaceae bacterium]|nr:hypothetical protein [Rhodocyclaceae bacterium]